MEYYGQKVAVVVAWEMGIYTVITFTSWPIAPHRHITKALEKLSSVCEFLDLCVYVMKQEPLTFLL